MQPGNIIITFPYLTRHGELDEFKSKLYSNPRKCMAGAIMALPSFPFLTLHQENKNEYFVPWCRRNLIGC